MYEEDVTNMVDCAPLLGNSSIPVVRDGATHVHLANYYLVEVQEPKLGHCKEGEKCLRDGFSYLALHSDPGVELVRSTDDAVAGNVLLFPTSKNRGDDNVSIEKSSLRRRNLLEYFRNSSEFGENLFYSNRCGWAKWKI